MNWLVKSLTFQVLSRTPGGQSIYHAAQRRLTGTSRVTEQRVIDKMQQAVRYWKCLEAHAPSGSLANASHLDLGAGWIPSVPMTFYALGTPKQYLVDITPHITPDTVVDTAGIFRAAAQKVAANFVRMPPVPERGLSLAATFETFGMVYAAPYDELARKISGSVGFATASSALFHMTRDILKNVFAGIYRMLRPGGYFLAQHYLRQCLDSLESPSSPFYALRYSDWFWETFTNSPMMYYNRLKARDYRELLEAAGFKMVCMETDPPPPEEYTLLDKARVHPTFAHYSREELAAKYLFLAARKPC